MKFPFMQAALAAVLILCCAELRASIHVGDRIKFNDGVGTPGGIFSIDDLNDPGNPDFATFCVEITEFINFTSTYAVQGIGMITVNGGKTLQPITAWLYNSFLEGTLASFNSSSVADVNALQLAIWKGMGYTASEIKSHIGTSWYNTYNPVLVGNLSQPGKPWYADFAADSSWSGVGSIRVMNLRKVVDGAYTDYAQDQLVRLPEPWSAVVWCLLGLSVGAFGSHRRSNRL
jgi:hypothetical protein